MYQHVLSATMIGLSCKMIHVEADVSDGMPVFDMVGFLACEVKEAKERVRTALRNSGMPLPPKRITVNLSPADVRKEGAAFDLPIAAAVLSAMGLVPAQALQHTLMIGELGLNGCLQPVRGILPIVMAAQKAGVRRCILPAENVKEGGLVKGIVCIGARDLTGAVKILKGEDRAAKRARDRDQREAAGLPDAPFLEEMSMNPENGAFSEDFSEVAGQEVVKRGAEIAAAGFHNLLLIGPPGAGKTLIARRIPTILPRLTLEESLEISRIYSVAGLLPPEQPLILKRPFRTPHHTITAAALIGGGRNPRPGEVSLAERGVLFLDELTEFQMRTLDLLRQPLEDKEVVIARTGGTYRYPANFMLVAAMNPCKCGYYPDRNKCTCSMREINAYLGRISQPLLDRMDLCVETPPVAYSQLAKGGAGTSSAVMRKRVEEAILRQKRRYQDMPWHFNSELPAKVIRTFCPLGPAEEQVLQNAFEKLNLSVRACHRIIRVARTIADLEGEAHIQRAHIAEAIGYRSIDKKYWS